jgi:steroid 5-alpha reductase family enzyme
VSLWAALGITLGVLVVFMTLGWLVSLARKDASVVDPIWGMGFIAAAVSYFFLLGGYSGRNVLVLASI